MFFEQSKLIRLNVMKGSHRKVSVFTNLNIFSRNKSKIKLTVFCSSDRARCCTPASPILFHSRRKTVRVYTKKNRFNVLKSCKHQNFHSIHNYLSISARKCERYKLLISNIVISPKIYVKK